MYVIVSVGFFMYSYFTFRYLYYENMGLDVERTGDKKQLLRRVAIITLLSMACFNVRAAVTLFSVFYAALDWAWWLDGLYYFSLEVLPMLAMLGAYLEPKKKHNSGLGVKSPLIRLNKEILE